MEQRTNEWYQARLGKITSSSVSKIIGKGKATPFTLTGMSYLNMKIAERLLPPEYLEDDDHFAMYQGRVEQSTKATKYGTAMEESARRAFTETMESKGYQIVETGFVESPDLSGWGDSPDGLVMQDGSLVAVLEIKCPFNPSNTIDYVMALNASGDDNKAEALKKVEPDYYWQCVSHCECNGVEFCVLVIYDEMVEGRMWCYDITPSPEDRQTLRQRVADALGYIEDATARILG